MGQGESSGQWSLTRVLHYTVAALLIVGIAGYWYLKPGGLDPAADPRAAKAIALVQTHRAHEAPTLLHALNDLVKKVQERGKGVRLGGWKVEQVRADYYLVRVWIREEGFEQWFERDFAWQVELDKGRVLPMTEWAVQLMPRNRTTSEASQESPPPES